MKARKPMSDAWKVLLVHPELEVLAKLQQAFAEAGASPIVARDLPTALLAATQHFFHVVVISSRLSEEGDGWPLAGIVRRVFPQSFVAVIAPERSVLTLQAAINHGLSRIFDPATTPEQMVEAALPQLPSGVVPSSPQQVN